MIIKNFSKSFHLERFLRVARIGFFTNNISREIKELHLKIPPATKFSKWVSQTDSKVSFVSIIFTFQLFFVTFDSHCFYVCFLKKL